MRNLRGNDIYFTIVSHCNCLYFAENSFDDKGHWNQAHSQVDKYFVVIQKASLSHIPFTHLFENVAIKDIYSVGNPWKIYGSDCIYNFNWNVNEKMMTAATWKKNCTVHFCWCP